MGDGKYKGVIPKAIGEIFDYIEKVLYSVFNLPTINWIFKKMPWSNSSSPMWLAFILFSNNWGNLVLCAVVKIIPFSWSNYVLIISFLGDVLTEIQTKLFLINKIPVTVKPTEYDYEIKVSGYISNRTVMLHWWGVGDGVLWDNSVLIYQLSW